MRATLLSHAVPRALRGLSVLVLAAGAVGAAGADRAAGPDFQYVGQDDKVHGLASPKGCVEAEGGGTRAVTNRTRATATLYREPRCAGPAVAVLPPGTVTQVRPYFASVRFSVTG
ncbi:hypothetical protein [Streptomyces sp. RerS4]|uniref:hypothetical protein n=1 Tax=Streptomyces sp. RerS4 TaxID=2942449 RepID=UPI00201C8A02|nr:hypothetical protein [Streptomyces sp. RerS4]UQX04300.1 hypothetical protein M4D82_30175 [Streptomyces sp. RerS4]